VSDPSSRSATRSAVRLRPVPPLDPPYEDELAPEIWAAGPGSGQLALDLTAGAPRARAGGGGGVRKPGAANGRERSAAPDAIGGNRAPAGPPAAGTPAGNEARHAARRFLAICLEVINGYRPLAHIRPLVSPADLEAVLAQVATGVERLARARRAGKRAPAQLRVVRVCEPRPGAVEAAAALGDAGRTWALAFRLERRQGRWVAIAVRVL
jgi:Family of unknown function (DUF6459)